VPKKLARVDAADDCRQAAGRRHAWRGQAAARSCWRSNDARSRRPRISRHGAWTSRSGSAFRRSATSSEMDSEAVRAAITPRREFRPYDPDRSCLPHIELCPDGAVIDARAGRIALQIPCSRTALLSNMPARCPAPAPPATSSFAKALPRLSLPTRSRTTCSTRPGASNRIPACRARRSSNATPLVIEIPRYSINMTKEG
jgi:2Fe-2S ferredoxin